MALAQHPGDAHLLLEHRDRADRRRTRRRADPDDVPQAQLRYQAAYRTAGKRNAAVAQILGAHDGDDDRLRPRHRGDAAARSEEHTSELQSLMRISYAVFCLKKKKTRTLHKKPDN